MNSKPPQHLVTRVERVLCLGGDVVTSRGRTRTRTEIAAHSLDGGHSGSPLGAVVDDVDGGTWTQVAWDGVGGGEAVQGEDPLQLKAGNLLCGARAERGPMRRVAAVRSCFCVPACCFPQQCGSGTTISKKEGILF